MNTMNVHHIGIIVDNIEISLNIKSNRYDFDEDETEMEFDDGSGDCILC